MTKNYQLETHKDRLILKTSSFKAEKTSVLHSGVYTREFTSMLFASGACIFSYMLTDIISSRPPVIRYAILILLFVAAFLGANKYIFKERQLEVVFNRKDKMIHIVRSGLITRKIEKIPFEKVKSIDIGSRKFVPDNFDGINFVQKISAQHGSAVPGLSDVEEFVTLSLRLIDGSEKIIFAAKIDGGKKDGEPDIPVREIRSFLDINDPVR